MYLISTASTLNSVLLSVLGTLLGAIVMDVYVHIKVKSKKHLDKKKAEAETELKEVITQTIDPKLGKIQEDIKVLKVAVRDSLRNQLLAVYQHCVKHNGRTVEETENWEYMYSSYTALEGNSFIVVLHDEFLELPVITSISAVTKQVQKAKTTNK